MNFADQLLVLVRDHKSGHQPVVLIDRESVVKELIFVYQCAIAVETLLSEAVRECIFQEDKFSGYDLKLYYEKHLEEETGEAPFLKRDLESLGVDLCAQPLNPMAVAMVGSQHYMINYVHPVALLGYMLIAETDPLPLEGVELLEKAHGKDSFSYIRMHTDKDVAHSSDLMEMIDRIPTEDLKAIVAGNLKMVLSFYGRR